MSKSIQDEIKTYYGGIAKKVSENSKASCCSEASCCADISNESLLYSEDFTKGLPIEAINASLGCANPLLLADLQQGETVLDLGSGGGIDVLISSRYVGDTGKVYGLDMTDEMLELANKNKEKIGVKNAEFIKGYIEDIPMQDESIDVVTSNCVINLTESKEDALAEAYRVLKNGGRLAIADIVQLKEVPEELKESIQMWIGCISGALTIIEYEKILNHLGFKEIEITVANIYTKGLIREIAESKDLSDMYAKIDEEAIDGAFAGAYVKAYK